MNIIKQMVPRKFTYQDSAEDYLLSLFSDGTQSTLQKEINAILINDPSWPIHYHLSPQRNFLLSWYPFKEDSNLLEIGAGCGGVTEVFLKKCRHVTAVELENKRASIIQKRFKNYKNLEVTSQDIFSFHTKEKFDYITLIGVLEYAGRFYGTPDIENYTYEPFISLIEKAGKLLTENGTLIIAIENKIGIKYFGGCLEDHYDSLFESIEDYPTYHGVRTFTKNELTHLLKTAGFSSPPEFYYPLPDYKLPTRIITDDMINITKNIAGLFPTNDPTHKKIPILNESRLAHTIFQENLLSTFLNSFLIFIRK